MKKSAQRKEKGAGSSGNESRAHLHAGATCHDQGCGLLMTKGTRERFGFKVNDYLYVESDDRSTKICRQVRRMPAGARGSLGYVYMDKDSLGLLNVDPHACLFVSKSDVTFEAP
jgi:hypothetical protein